MEQSERIAALQAIALARSGQEVARLKGEVSAIKLVMAHLLHAASEDTKIEARVALQLLLQQVKDADALAGVREVARICQSANPPSPPPREEA